MTGDDAEHIWWFRPSGTTEVVWRVASESRNASLVASCFAGAGVDERRCEDDRRRLRQPSVACVALRPFTSRLRYRRRRPLRRRRAALRGKGNRVARVTSPISSCAEPHQDTHKRPTKNPSVQVTASRGRALRSTARQPPGSLTCELAKASDQVAGDSRTCQSGRYGHGAPRGFEVSDAPRCPETQCTPRPGSAPRKQPFARPSSSDEPRQPKPRAVAP